MASYKNIFKITHNDVLPIQGSILIAEPFLQDAYFQRSVVLLIEQIGGAACHEGYRSCFSRELRDGKVSRCSELVFDPKEVYNG